VDWPYQLLEAFAQALEIEPAEGWTVEEVLQGLLDDTARRVVWRTKGDPTHVADALRSPYTPLGSVVGDAIGGRAARFTLKGSEWKPAVDAFYEYFEENAEAIYAAFRDEPQRYDDLMSGPVDRNGS
jgi:hypothetical protein